jgi:hypothetical protein
VELLAHIQADEQAMAVVGALAEKLGAQIMKVHDMRVVCGNVS